MKCNMNLHSIGNPRKLDLLRCRVEVLDIIDELLKSSLMRNSEVRATYMNCIKELGTISKSYTDKINNEKVVPPNLVAFYEFEKKLNNLSTSSFFCEKK